MGLKNLPTVVAPDARERILCPHHFCDLPVDQRLAAASKSFKGFDWSLAKGAGGSRTYEKLILKTDLASRANIRRRGRKLTQYLLKRPEANLTVVSHGGFLMRLTGDSYMDNCEVRTYEVTPGRWPTWRLKKVYTTACKGLL